MSQTPPKFHETVIFLAKLLKNTQYAIRGTASLVLQGYEMNVDDIDIVCDEKTALEINSLTEVTLDVTVSEPVAYKESPKYKSYYGKFFINEVQVEIMGEWQINNNGVWSEKFDASDRHEITIEGNKVWVTTIESELKMFIEMNRFSAYHKIKKQYTDKNPKPSQNSQIGLF